MKRLMSVFILAVLLVSCSSDDDADVYQGILGEWKLIQANVENPIDVNGDGVAETDLMEEIPCFTGTSEFLADGTFSQSFAQLEITEVNGEPTYGCNGFSTNSGIYELNGNQLKLTIDGPEPEVSVHTILIDGDILKTTLPDLGDLGDVELVYRRQ